MSYLVLARKYRPQSFEQVIGQEHVTRTLMNSIQSDRVAHALIFAGPRGVGKTSVARILAKALNCKDGPTTTPCDKCDSCHEIRDGITVDVFEIDGASNRGINEIRELRENIKYMPSRSRNKIYIIDEVHMLTAEAFNALLKTLEEPPEHVIFIFATTELHKIPVTIQSRCQIYNFRRINSTEIADHLKNVCEKTGTEISEGLLWLIAREAEGGMRDALSLLDQVMAYSDDRVTDEQVLDILGLVDRKTISDMASAIISNQITDALQLLDDLYLQGHDIKRLYGLLIEHFRNMLIVKMSKDPSRLLDLPEHDIKRMKEDVEDLSAETINQFFQTLFAEEKNIRFAPQPKLAVEMALISVALLTPVVSIETIIEKLDALQKRPAQGKGVRDAAMMMPAESPKIDSQGSGISERTASYNPETVDPETGPGDMDCKDIWKKVLQILEQKYPSVAVCLENSALKSRDNDRLTIAIRGNSFETQRVQDKKKTIESVCSDFLGQKIHLEIAALPDNPASDSKKKTDSNRRHKNEALNNPIVMDTLDIFGGRVVDVKVL